MRVGIYNRWLATLGGGERYSLAVAEYISRQYSVDVITHKSVPKDSAAKRLNLDLSRVEFVTIPERHAIEISPVSADYDLFINTSFMDFFPSFAKKNISIIYFPAKLNRKVIAKRKVKLLARKWLKLPALIAGIHSFDNSGSTFLWVTDTVVKICLPTSIFPYVVKFDLCAKDKNVTKANIFLNAQRISSITFPGLDEYVPCEVPIPRSKQKTSYELTIQVDNDVEPDGNAKIGIKQLWLSLPQFRIYQVLFERWQKDWGTRLQYYPPGSSILEYIDTYDSIWAISEFSKKWIKQYWLRDSEVLYPPVNIEDFQTKEKRQQILSVGRFFAGQHNKKHQELIAAFKEMVDRGLTDWELHLAGGKTPGDEHETYLANVHESSKGYPIIIHPDIPFQQLVDLYEESAIYWHASGYGEDEKQDPVKFEHFGITTVEAMAAGCVPIVIGKGGQPEIVEHGKNGFLWQSLEELQNLTIQLIRDPSLRNSMAVTATQDSKRYGKIHFHTHLNELLRKIEFPI